MIIARSSMDLAKVKQCRDEGIRPIVTATGEILGWICKEESLIGETACAESARSQLGAREVYLARIVVACEGGDVLGVEAWLPVY